MHFFRAGMFFILSWKACNWVRFISVIAIGVCSNLMCLWKVPLAFTWLLGMLTSSPRLARMGNVCAGRHIYRINQKHWGLAYECVGNFLVVYWFYLICICCNFKKGELRTGVAILTHICIFLVKWLERLIRLLVSKNMGKLEGFFDWAVLLLFTGLKIWEECVPLKWCVNMDILTGQNSKVQFLLQVAFGSPIISTNENVPKGKQQEQRITGSVWLWSAECSPDPSHGSCSSNHPEYLPFFRMPLWPSSGLLAKGHSQGQSIFQTQADCAALAWGDFI